MVKPLVWLAAASLALPVAGMQPGNGAAAAGEGARLARSLRAEALASLEKAEAERGELKTPESIRRRQRRMKEFMRAQLGLPTARTPLLPQSLGLLDRDGYRIERLTFESQPGFVVTANLYLPAGPPPYPGVLFPCGHSQNGKAGATYQLAAILLARTGLATLVYDPIGQGERNQILRRDGKPAYGPTAEHNAVAASCMLVGRSTDTYRVWDGMRGLDYLQSRPDIKGAQLGCTGNSGGGTLTSYLFALDDRIKAAAPSCYLTTFSRLLQTIGPQDAEQNIYGQAAAGLDHADYLLMGAPAPAIICAAQKDFFDIAGARSTFSQLQEIYRVLGSPERVSMAVADESHGFTQPLREAAASWLGRWLLGASRSVEEPPASPLPESKLLCVEPSGDQPGGQVVKLSGARTVMDLNHERAVGLAGARTALWKNERRALDRVRLLAGIRREKDLPQPALRATPPSEPAGPERISMATGLGCELSGLRWRAGAPRRRIVVFLDRPVTAWAAEKSAELARWAIDTEVVAVEAPFASGRAAPRVAGSPPDDSSAVSALAYLLGRSRVGLDAELMLQAVRAAGERKLPTTLITTERFSIAALHLAALEPARFKTVDLQGGWRSYIDIVGERQPTDMRDLAVHGALEVYDLTDLARSLGDRLTWTGQRSSSGPRRP